MILVPWTVHSQIAPRRRVEPVWPQVGPRRLPAEIARSERSAQARIDARNDARNAAECRGGAFDVASFDGYERDIDRAAALV